MCTSMLEKINFPDTTNLQYKNIYVYKKFCTYSEIIDFCKSHGFNLFTKKETIELFTNIMNYYIEDFSNVCIEKNLNGHSFWIEKSENDNNTFCLKILKNQITDNVKMTLYSEPDKDKYCYAIVNDGVLNKL